jgi:hypothetical protein
MNRILAAITPVHVAWKAAWAKSFDVMPPMVMFIGWLLALAVGAASGAALAGAPVTKAPHQCTVMANLADGAFNAYEDQVIAVHNMATRGMSEFADNEAKVEGLWVELDGLKADHGVAKAECLGEDR